MRRAAAAHAGAAVFGVKKASKQHRHPAALACVRNPIIAELGDLRWRSEAMLEQKRLPASEAAPGETAVREDICVRFESAEPPQLS